MKGCMRGSIIRSFPHRGVVGVPSSVGELGWRPALSPDQLARPARRRRRGPSWNALRRLGPAAEGLRRRLSWGVGACHYRTTYC
jgi:hypothetical protein